MYITETKIQYPEMFEIILPIPMSSFSTNRLIVDIAIFKAFVNGLSLDVLQFDLISYCLYKCNRAVNSVEYSHNCAIARFQYEVYELYLTGDNCETNLQNKTLWSIEECSGGIQLNLINEVSYDH
jgi:hypothetical protein